MQVYRNKLEGGGRVLSVVEMGRHGCEVVNLLL